MTSNQLKRDENLEKQRANMAQEAENVRSNKAKEKQAKKDLVHKYVDTGVKGVTSLAGSLAKLFTGGKNDARWYAKDPNLVSAAANISFGTPIGSVANIATQLGNGTTRVTNTQRGVPGFAVLRYLPTIGDPQTMDAIARKLYAYVRHANSGHANYESNDLLMYLLATTEVYSAIAHSTRVYALLNTFRNDSFYYGKSYLRGLGLEYSSFANNIANFRVKINTWIRRVNSFNMPKNFPIFERRMWLCSGIYKDHPVKRSSNYIFCPDVFLKFNETDVPTGVGAMLEPVQLGNPSKTIQYNLYCNKIDQMLDALYQSEDLGIMSGDMLKAYGDSGLYKLAEIPADFKVEPEFNAEVLTQINGATSIGAPIYNTFHIYTKMDDSTIQQGDPNTLGSVKEAIALESSSNALYEVEVNEAIINMYKDDVTPDDIMVATRLSTLHHISRIDNPSEGVYRYIRQIDSCGSEVLVDVEMCVCSLNEDGKTVNITTFLPANDGQLFTNTTISKDLQIRTANYNNFDWAPRVRFLYHNGTNTNVIYDSIDIANYAIVNMDTMNNIHKVALMSLFDL